MTDKNELEISIKNKETAKVKKLTFAKVFDSKENKSQIKMIKESNEAEVIIIDDVSKVIKKIINIIEHN